MKNFIYSTLLLCANFVCMPQVVIAQESTAETEAPETELQQEIQDLKKQVLKLNRNLFILEEDLLFPSNTQFSVFLSMDAGQLFALDSVQLKIDDKMVSSHLYTER